MNPNLLESQFMTNEHIYDGLQKAFDHIQDVESEIDVINNMLKNVNELDKRLESVEIQKL